MAYRSTTFCSAAMRKLHRDFERRRKLAVLAMGGVAKKSSAPPPPRRSAPIPPTPAGAAIKKSTAPLPPPRSAWISRSPRRERVLTPPTPPRRSAPIPSEPARASTKKSSAPPHPPRSAPISRSPRTDRVLAPVTAPPRSSAASVSIRKGAQVRVRTPAGTLPTGQRLVLWLSAVVISAAEDGFLHVVYKGKFPPDDPFRTVRVATDQVKIVPPADASSTPAATAAVPRPSSGKVAPRPTVAGKSLPVLRRLEKEMRSQSEAIVAAW